MKSTPPGRPNRGRRLLRGLGAALGVFALFQVLARLFKRAVPLAAPPYVGRFLDSRLRLWALPPERVVARSGLRQGQRVLELGCGSGAYTPYLARALGREGRLIAVDLQPAMLRLLRRKLSSPAGRVPSPVNVAAGDALHLPFRDHAFDLACLVTVLPEVRDKPQALAELRRVLTSGGLLAITEFLPDPDYPLMPTTLRWGLEAGFELERTYGNLWTYTVRLRNPPATRRTVNLASEEKSSLC